MTTTPAYFDAQDTSIEEFHAICSRTTQDATYLHASAIEKNIVLYDGDVLRSMVGEELHELSLKKELCHVLKSGPGVFIIKHGFADISVIDTHTAILREIVLEEKDSLQGEGDHFGQNERVWNAIQKVSQKAPDAFIDYYSNPLIGIACEAWLGPAYQISAQMNNVKPGNKAQASHRDYHLGFQSSATIKQFPAHAQVMSQYLTLQGAVIHSNMPLISGPTLFLPFSQQYAPGYLAYAQPEFRAYFDENHVQVPLSKGDLVFFSPAVFHGAGTNMGTTDRIANLLQISSAFGKTMETIDHEKMIAATYPTLLKRKISGAMAPRQIQDIIAAIGDGYSFPTNLDSDPPLNGNAPETGQHLLSRALSEQWSLEHLISTLEAYAERRRA